MAGEAQVTIRFTTTLPVAMVTDWSQALGLLDPQLHEELQFSSPLEVEITGETRIGPSDTPVDVFTVPVLVAVRRLLCFFPRRHWHMQNLSSWLAIDFEPAWGEEATPESDGRKFAIWLNTGDVYRCGADGEIDDDTGIIPLADLDPEKDRL